MSRSVGVCVICGGDRLQIVSKGRCARCLMRERRGEAVDSLAYLRELRGNLTSLQKAATVLEDAQIPDIFVSAEDYQTLRRIIHQGMDRIEAARKEYRARRWGFPF